MAEPYETKLVISADTSDAEKKLKDVGNTKVPTVKVDVVADEVKVDAPKVEPVKVPVTADSVKIDAPKVEPVKVPVTADSVKIDAPKVEPVKVPVDDAQAVGALSRIKAAIHGVQSAFAALSRGLGMIHFAISGINTLINAYTWLKDKLHETERAAAKLRDEMSRSRIEERVKREAVSYDKLNKALAETNRLEKERNDILAGRKTAERTLEDENDELAKQNEIAALDPNSEDYKKRKAEIERKYADRASDRRAERAGEDVRKQAKDLYGQADARDRDANALQAEADKRNKTFELARERSWALSMKARSGKDEDVAAHKEAEKAADAAYDAWKKVDEEIKKMRGEAQSIRNRAGELAGGNLAANKRRDAEKQATANDERERAADEKKESDRKAKEAADKAKTAQQSVEDARLNRQKQEDLAALNPADKDYAAKVREVERTYDTRAAEDKVKRAKTPEERQAAEEELEAIQIQHDRERREEAAGKIGELESFAAQAASFDGVSQNRLTAMGLGSGVSATGGVATDVKTLVKLLEKEIEATKNIQPGEAQPATYGA